MIDWWPVIVAFAHVAGALAVTVDAVLRKRHVQAIVGWVGLAWLAPIVGACIYLLFGVNRISRVARALRVRAFVPPGACPQRTCAVADTTTAAMSPALAGLARVGSRLTGNPLVPGNSVVPLENGDSAYPQMLAAIEGAERSISLQTYIFDLDEVGSLFCEKLAEAARRGVAVRVLVDDVGARYSRVSVVRALRRANVGAATFLPTHLPRSVRYANLRSHRKIMVVDGAVGFTGGMNLRSGHWLGYAPAHPVRCMHFRLEGPVVGDLQRTFALDWAFATGETLSGEAWFPPLRLSGAVLARGIPDGPDEDLGKMPNVLLGALMAAERSVDVVTPYFLPDDVLLRTLQITAMRGVEVRLVLPSRSNIPLMDWAMRPQLKYLLDDGCQIYLSPPPFDHTKLFVVDGTWSLIGSTNWDARSLRLNFEYNVECYDERLASSLSSAVQARMEQAHRLERSELLRDSVAVRLRNGLARLLSPYL